eukprot:TRINITY_DN2335_c5_g1_i1.p1 TRINITY_DN2335_c5_g1~~TRINITY_DN2335_c5_g1_i1.p1  ORF type:complete len:249 (+),score=51.12 TRINITY_DN2335_c5_g1_i1:46-792(+)
MQPEADVALKVEIQRGNDKEVRRIPAPKTFSELSRQLFEWNVDSSTSIIRYLDGDGDEVTISTDMEWGEALRELKASTFRIIVKVDCSADFPSGSSVMSIDEIETAYPNASTCMECLKYLFGGELSTEGVSRSTVYDILGHFGEVSAPEVSPSVFEDIRWLVDNKYIIIGATTENSAELFADRPMNSFVFRPSTRFPGRMVLTTKRAEGISHHFIALGTPSTCNAKTLRELAVTMLTKRLKTNTEYND